VLFLCTGNSARSVMAECAISRWGKGKFKGFSAGSHPKGTIHPMTLELLKELHYETSNLCSKSGMSSRERRARRSTLCSRSATRRGLKSVRYGRGSR
jgi:protein-tyrosine-phosphatase